MEGKLELLKKQIEARMAQKEQVIIAIDGSCTAGKTTLSAALVKIYDCNVFHMDDFFLRPGQRTAARAAEIGGNVDYERFRSEVLIPLKTGKAFSYRPYDCKAQALADPVPVTPKKLNIIEGSYSLHPFFGEIYDLKIFLTVSPELRRQRILLRPPALQQRFFNEWIPMEQRYFEEFHISDRCDLVL